MRLVKLAPALSLLLSVPVQPAAAQLSGYGTAVLDAVLSPGEWDGAARVDLPVNVPGGGTTPGSLFVMNDDANVYLAARYQRAFVDPGNSLGARFDPGDDGGLDNSDDEILLIPGAPFFDYYRTNAPPCPAGNPPGWCLFEDADEGGTTDGGGAFANDGAVSVYELAHPLDSGDPHDVSLSIGETVGLSMSLRMIGPGGMFPEDFEDTDWPGGIDTASVLLVPEPRAGLPAGVALAALVALRASVARRASVRAESGAEAG